MHSGLKLGGSLRAFFCPVCEQIAVCKQAIGLNQVTLLTRLFIHGNTHRAMTNALCLYTEIKTRHDSVTVYKWSRVTGEVRPPVNLPRV